jgi:hypothetical protein
LTFQSGKLAPDGGLSYFHLTLKPNCAGIVPVYHALQPARPTFKAKIVSPKLFACFTGQQDSMLQNNNLGSIIMYFRAPSSLLVDRTFELDSELAPVFFTGFLLAIFHGVFKLAYSFACVQSVPASH